MSWGKRRRWVLIGSAVLFYATAGWLLLCSISSAHLNFLACPEGFSLWADRPECQVPKVLELGALAVFVTAIVTTFFAVRSRPHTRSRSDDLDNN